MAKKVVIVSDLSGNEVPDDEQVEVRVLEFPELSQPVKLDASKTETDRLKLEGTQLALLELVTSDGQVERLAISADTLTRAVRGDIMEVMANAEGIYKPALQPEPQPEEPKRRGRRPRGEAAPGGEKIDYTSVEYAGRVKRGIVSDGEKQTVREHFDEVNRNLEAAGQRTLDLSDIAIVERYSLHELAQERGITPTAK
jgi:hypothetical protein